MLPGSWKSLLPNIQLARVNPYSKVSNKQCGINLKLIESLGEQVESVVTRYAPEVATIVSEFSDDVTYIPVSAQGRPPVVDPESGRLFVRANELRPMWAEVPLITAINKSCSPLIPRINARKNAGVAARVHDV